MHSFLYFSPLFVGIIMRQFFGACAKSFPIILLGMSGDFLHTQYMIHTIIHYVLKPFFKKINDVCVPKIQFSTLNVLYIFRGANRDSRSPVPNRARQGISAYSWRIWALNTHRAGGAEKLPVPWHWPVWRPCVFFN